MKVLVGQLECEVGKLVAYCVSVPNFQMATETCVMSAEASSVQTWISNATEGMLCLNAMFAERKRAATSRIKNPGPLPVLSRSSSSIPGKR